MYKSQILECVMGFGLGALALEEHRQTRQLVPSALILLEIDAVDCPRLKVVSRVCKADGQKTGHHEDTKPNEYLDHVYLRPWPENSTTLSAAYWTLMKVF